VVALVLEEVHTGLARERMDRWIDEGTLLHAPLLLQYEIATVLTEKLAEGRLSKEKADEALQIIDELDVIFHITPNNSRAIELARAMDRKRASDAAYLVVAEELGTLVWTFDKKLANNHASRHLTKLID
jgi:predicted nucleic acid-binding protein